MDPIPALVRRLWDAWDVRILVLLSLALQMILSLFGNRRKYISSLWISILLWSAYLLADWVATVALGKLSDAQVDNDSVNALRAIWAPLLLLHLGGPDTITAYSLEDNKLWMRHLLGLVIQFSVAVYVILMSWKQSWFSTMSIPALVAGFIKYGERTWVLMSVSHENLLEIVPFCNKEGGSRFSNVLSSNPHYLCSIDSSEFSFSLRVLCLAHKLLNWFKSFMLHYDLDGEYGYSGVHPREVWKAVEVEMGLMFDLLYTKASINFSKWGWILRCVTFTCTVTVLMGLIFRLISTGEDREKWHKVDIAITAVLLVGALALEIYAIISLYLCSDWAMLWLIKHNRGKQGVQLTFVKKWLGIFLPKEYRCNRLPQFNLFDENFRRDFKPDLRGARARGIIWWWWKKYILNKYVQEPAVFDPSHLFEPLSECRARLRGDSAVGRDLEVIQLSVEKLEDQIILFHKMTELLLLYKDSAESQHTTSPSGSSSSLWKEDRKLCRALSRYMMYLLVMRTRLLPAVSLSDTSLLKILHEELVNVKYNGLEKYMTDQDRTTVKHLKSKDKNEMWKILKYKWVRMLCDAASKGDRNEHLGQLSQGGEFLTFLWFFLPSWEEPKETVNPSEDGDAVV